MRASFLALPVPTVAPARAQSNAPAMSADTLKDVARTLSSDAFDGRAPTMPAEGKTVDCIQNRYDKPQDEYDPDWNWTGAVQDLTLYCQLGRGLAEGTMWPNRNGTAEFRAVREKARAGQ